MMGGVRAHGPSLGHARGAAIRLNISTSVPTQRLFTG
jgi:hypothetical protein